MSFYKRTGELIFGTRLKRLSDRFLLDVTKTYKSLSIPFETSWFPLFYLLNENESMSVTEIAKELEITHSAVSQLVTTVEKKGYITFFSDENDKRKRMIKFTESGRDLMKTIRPVWEAIQRAMYDILCEKDHSAGLFAALDEVEDCLNSQPLHQRIINELNINEINVKQIHAEVADESK